MHNHAQNPLPVVNDAHPPPVRVTHTVTEQTNSQAEEEGSQATAQSRTHKHTVIDSCTNHKFTGVPQLVSELHVLHTPHPHAPSLTNRTPPQSASAAAAPPTTWLWVAAGTHHHTPQQNTPLPSNPHQSINQPSMAASRALCVASSAAYSWPPRAAARGGGTALPTCLWRECTLPLKRKWSGKPCWLMGGGGCERWWVGGRV